MKMHGEYTSRISGSARFARPTGRTGAVPFRKTSTRAPNGVYFRTEVRDALEGTEVYRCPGCGHGHKGRGDARRCCK